MILGCPYCERFVELQVELDDEGRPRFRCPNGHSFVLMGEGSGEPVFAGARSP